MHLTWLLGWPTLDEDEERQFATRLGSYKAVQFNDTHALVYFRCGGWKILTVLKSDVKRKDMVVRGVNGRTR